MYVPCRGPRVVEFTVPRMPLRVSHHFALPEASAGVFFTRRVFAAGRLLSRNLEPHDRLEMWSLSVGWLQR